MSQPSSAPVDVNEGESVEVLIPGRTHPLHVALPNGCAGTTVRELREATLAQLRAADPSSTAQFIRLIFRGKELKESEQALASQAIQNRSALHGMATRVQPNHQQLESEAGAARRAARQALTSAVGSLLGGDSTSDGAASDPVAVTAGARAQMSQQELLRLLHEETMLRRRAAGGSAPGPSAAPEPTETAVHIAEPSPQRQEEVETTDGGRVRVTTLADRADRPQQQPGQEADPEVVVAAYREQYNVFKWSFISALLAGFLLGPAALFLPFEKIEVGCVMAGFCLNIVCNFMW